MAILAIAGLLFSLGRTYIANAAKAYGAIQATSGGTLANFNAAQLMGDKNGPTVELTNLIVLEQQLKEFGPEVFNKFKRDARKLGTPARDEVRDAFSRIGPTGPFGRRVRPGRYYDSWNTVNGRLSWDKGYYNITSNTGIDVNYKSRSASKELYKLKTGQDGAISVLRVRVKKAPLVLADMAGRSGTSMYSQGRFRTRPYEIDLFGRGIVTRTHRINQDNSDKFVERLNRSRSKLQGKASRYAWPALEKHTPTYTKNVDRLLNETIAVINRNLEK